jgi:CheY-like chemotaxis protein
MKVLFLDVDGVLNSGDWYRSARPQPSGIEIALLDLDPAAVARLLTVLELTGAEVVLSSTWRLVPQYITMLRESGIPVDGMTPRMDGAARCREIAEWLGAHPEVQTYAIIDDDADAWASGSEKFVRTTWEHGMLDTHAAQLVKILGER